MRSGRFGAVVLGLVVLCGRAAGPPAPPGARALLAAAQTAFNRDPADEGNIIWLGRRLAYLGRYQASVAVYTGGLALHPESFRLRRHRGHRYITLRQLDSALVDLRLAAILCLRTPDAIEPDGLPNARNSPTGSDRTNIYYHLGLAWYLKRHWDQAAEAYRRCLEFSTNDDMRVAASYWLYLSLRRAGRDPEAAMVLDRIRPDADIVENLAYHRLLLMFKCELTPESVAAGLPASPVGPAVDAATVGYGIGAWHLLNGNREEALAHFREVLGSAAWPAFGFIAAESEAASGAGL